MRPIHLLQILPAALLTLSVLVDASEKCGVCGLYRLTTDRKDPALDELWKAMDLPETCRKQQANSSNVTMHIRKEHSKYSVETLGNLGGELKYSFTPGEEYTITFCETLKVPATTTVNDEGTKLDYTLKLDGHDAKVVAESKNGGKNLLFTYTARGKTAEENYAIIGPSGAKGEGLKDALKKLLGGNSPKGKKKDDEDKKGTKANVALLPISAEV